MKNKIGYQRQSLKQLPNINMLIATAKEQSHIEKKFNLKNYISEMSLGVISSLTLEVVNKLNDCTPKMCFLNSQSDIIREEAKWI